MRTKSQAPLFLLTVIICSLFLLSSTSNATNDQQQATVSYSDSFSEDSGLWTYSGTAYRDQTDQNIVLNEADYGQAGVVFFKHSISGPFTASFSYLVGGGPAYSGDALIMFFYTQENSTLGGSGVSSRSSVPGYGIEFDGWANWARDFLGISGAIINPPTGEPSDFHIGLVEGSVSNHLAYTGNEPRVCDNVWHRVKVQVQESSVSVYVDHDLVLQWKGTLNKDYSGFGFTGNTGGGGTNYHIIDNFSITANVTDTSKPTPTPPSGINTVTAPISPFGKPSAVAVSPKGTYAYVANTYGDRSLSVINTVNNNVTARIPIGNNPSAVAVSPDGEYIYVTDDRYYVYRYGWYNGSVLVISNATKNVETKIPIGLNANGLIMSPDGAYAYVTNKGEGSVSVINTTTKTVTATVIVGNNVTAVAVSPNGEHIYVAGDNSVSVINTVTNTVAATIPVGTDACAVAISPNGEYAYVTNRKDSSVSVINTITNIVNMTITLEDKPWDFVSVILPSGSEAYATSSTQPSKKEPCDVAVSPDGTYAYITNYYSLTVSVIKIAESVNVSIVAPENTTYSTNKVPLTFTANEQASSIYYSIDKEANLSITENTTLTGLSNGAHSIVVYANDSYSKTKASETIYFTISKEDDISQVFLDSSLLPILAVIIAAPAIIVVIHLWKRKHQFSRQK